jgi:hypothetical protein
MELARGAGLGDHCIRSPVPMTITTMNPTQRSCPDVSLCQAWALGLSIVLSFASPLARAEETVRGRPSVVLENPAARLVFDVAGGALGEFQLQGSELNPLSWSRPAPGETAIHGFGHFVCLDRWGPPSPAEGAKGMPYHGEAANVTWRVDRAPALQTGAFEAQMSATLPKAGLSVRRTVRMSRQDAIAGVREEVTNDKALGRIYNFVQHPTIGPPFLDENTLVDCNGWKGFAQKEQRPTPEEPSFVWPQGLNEEGAAVSMRRLTNALSPSVVSYALDSAHGWITAAAPAKGLLIGYFWATQDYPWVSLWRDLGDGKMTARGLEFGTTGLHQPFPILVKKGRIWDRPLFEYLDAGETVAKSYLVFLIKIPSDFTGVSSIELNQGRLLVRERGDNKPREFSLDASNLISTESGIGSSR